MNIQDPCRKAAATVRRKIAFVTLHAWPWLRQTEDGEGRHLDLEISLAPSYADDWIVVYDDIPRSFATHVPLNRRALFITEPPGQKHYLPRFANQFGVLVSPYMVAGFEGSWIQSHPAINWFYGVARTRGVPATSRASLAELRKMAVPNGKRNRISVVCSTKSRLPRHRERLRLIERLKRSFPNSLDVYGQGFTPIADKADAIAPYRYHLALENNDLPHFWTEKLADAYLGYTLPVYSGCRNVTDYFPERSLVQLPDITDHDGIVAAIDAVLSDDPWDEQLDAIRAARSELIERQNLFSLIARIAETQSERRDNLGDSQQTIHPCRDFYGIAGVFRRQIAALQNSKSGR